ncbi:conserved Plasmodium protein, unknown function [Plasmodium sp. DRC-Itaito]|nr:conserved Plasmodium protein, unknown function [Plasmodium sp. DRC-Itaito]
MLQYMRERKKYGKHIPKSLSSKINKRKLIQKNICTNYKTIKIIDIYENLPYNQLNNGRTKIKEIILANDVLVVLLISGISRAYNMINGEFLCEINPNNFSVVHTIVYNSYNNTLIIAYASFPAHLQCKVIDCNDLKHGITNSSKLGILFERVILSHPAFFEFCETNGRIGAANLNTNSYTFWNMETYEPVFEIEEEFQEIRVSDGLVAMFKQPVNNTIPLALFDIQNGERLVETVISILPRREMQFLELLVSKLLIKQEGSSLRIYDLLKKTRQKVKNTYTFQPTAFVFYDHPSPINGKVYNNEISKKFFTISNNLIEFWELDSFMLRKMYTIYVPGLRDPDLCNHSLMAEILCIYSSNAFEKIRKYENLFTYVDYGNLKESELYKKRNEEETDLLYKKRILSNNIQDKKLKSDIKKEQFNYGALLFFSLNDGEFLNYISENICGNSVEVLASNSSMTTLVCGDDKGFIRILRNNPKYDDFEIKNTQMIRDVDKKYCTKLFNNKIIKIDERRRNSYQTKRKKSIEKQHDLLKKAKMENFSDH